MKNIALLLLIATMMACKHSPKTPSSIAETAQSLTEAVDPAKATSISFTEDRYDFGKVNVGEIILYNFKFKNTGDKPLIISNVSASCGCTTPNWSNEPIAPGKEGNIDVKFDTHGKMGMQEKTITVTANTNPAQTELRLFGEIEEK